jgi:hypothetical protein
MWQLSAPASLLLDQGLAILLDERSLDGAFGAKSPKNEPSHAKDLKASSS